MKQLFTDADMERIAVAAARDGREPAEWLRQDVWNGWTPRTSRTR
ncbi:hypothetical protein AB0C13_18785 [Streptomyces sp. NPDC049099]